MGQLMENDTLMGRSWRKIGEIYERKPWETLERAAEKSQRLESNILKPKTYGGLIVGKSWGFIVGKRFRKSGTHFFLGKKLPELTKIIVTN